MTWKCKFNLPNLNHLVVCQFEIFRFQIADRKIILQDHLKKVHFTLSTFKQKFDDLEFVQMSTHFWSCSTCKLILRLWRPEQKKSMYRSVLILVTGGKQSPTISVECETDTDGIIIGNLSMVLAVSMRQPL